MRVTLILSAVLSLFSFDLAFAEVEIFYFANQQAYRVAGVEAGKPKLIEDADEAVLDYVGPRHKSWWVKGELPLEPGWAHAFAGFGTKRVANSYQERFKPLRYSVWATPGHVWKDEEELNEHPGALFVLGWVRDGKVTRYAVSAMNSSAGYSGTINMEISEEEFGGYPLCWLVEDGEILEMAASEWDRAFLGSDVLDMAELAKFRDGQEYTALHYAAAFGDRILAEKLIATDKNLVRVSGKDQISPLSMAAANGRAGVVDLLLKNKASLLDGTDDLNSVVRKAARNGHFETLKLLAPGKPKGAEGRWHYSWAASDALNENYEDIAMYLIESGADFTVEKERRGPFVLAKFTQGYPELGFRLMEKFKLASNLEEDGYNLLHSVASYADVPLLDQVSKLGVNLTQQTEKGYYPVDHAVGLGNVDAICWFLDNGGRYEVGANGIDPLKRAISSHQLASVECLIGYGYDVNREIAPGLTSLMFAAYFREFEIARTIADAGGVFLLDSEHLNVTVLRLVAADQAGLLRKVIDQGWESDRRIFGAFTLVDCAKFYGSDSVLAELESRSWDLSEYALYVLAEVDQKPKLTTALQVDYPQELQEKFGNQTVLVKVGLAENGVPVLVEMKDGLGKEELAGVVERAVYSLRFAPAEKGGIAVPVSLHFRVPLTVEFDPASVFSIADVSEKPSALAMATPYYPYEMQFSRAKGKVIVEFVLMPDGSVRGTKVVSSTHEAFERPALSCVQQSSWSPARKDGKPVACLVRIPILFEP